MDVAHPAVRTLGWFFLLYRSGTQRTFTKKLGLKPRRSTAALNKQLDEGKTLI